MHTTLYPTNTAMLEIDHVRSITDKSEQAYQIARQFESLLIQEVVKIAPAESGGWLGDSADETSESVVQMGEQFLARALASGGFGIAAQFTPLIQRDLEQAGSPSPSWQGNSPETLPTRLR